MFPLLTVLLLMYARTGSADQQKIQPDFALRPGSDELMDSPNFLSSRSSHYTPYLSPGYFPSLSNNLPSYDTKVQQDLENENSFDVQKRISRLVVDPHSKRWSEVFRVSPKVFRELRNNGQNIRPFFRKDLVDGGFKMSYAAARKRPYYYTEPEGSEFLGGPGK